jgi:hypothetical protein
VSPAPTSAYFDVAGLRVAVAGDWPEVIRGLSLDFAWFRSEHGAAPDVTIEVERRAPDFGAYGELPAAFVTPRNVVYQEGPLTIVDYFGRAISVLDRPRNHLTVQGEDLSLVHEAAYHFMVSRVGEHIDASGLARLHALGLCGPKGAAAVLLPSGGGKSTLALKAIEDDRIKILSEDSPLIDRRGRMHPFPLRIGVNATDAAKLPESSVRRIERMEFHPKLALELDYFRDRIEREPQPVRHLLVGRRTLGTEARLDPLPRRAALATLLREVVVGVGIYQGMEFVLQRGPGDVLRQTGAAAGRAACSAAVLRNARVWRFTVGRDSDRNWATLRSLIA